MKFQAKTMAALVAAPFIAGAAGAGGGAGGGAHAVEFFITATIGGFTKEGLTDERDGEENGDDGDCDEVVSDDVGCHGVES